MSWCSGGKRDRPWIASGEGRLTNGRGFRGRKEGTDGAVLLLMLDGFWGFPFRLMSMECRQSLAIYVSEWSGVANVIVM